MAYTEEDEQRVAEAIYKADPCFYTYNAGDWEPSDFYSDDLEEHWREIARKQARAALAAMEREPLEHVLRDTRSWLQHLEVESRDDGQFSCTVYGYEVTVKGSPVMDATRYGADPAEAIHNAIAAAQEER